MTDPGPISLTPTYGHVHSLDGMRAVSVLLVMISHFGLEHLIPGGLGVTCFFFISGFIITGLLLLELVSTGTIDVRAFFVRRFWRLWPATAAAVLATVVLIGATPGHAISALLLVQNYWWILFDPTSSNLNIHWSLGVEAHFYLFWPLVILLFWRLGNHLIPFCLALALLSVGLRFLAAETWTVSDDLLHKAIYKASHLRVDSLLAGSLLALVAWARRRECFSPPGWLICVGLAVLVMTLVARDPWYRMTARYAVQSAALFMIFAALLYAERAWLFREVLNWKPLVWIGGISFSLYLWHILVWTLITHAVGDVSGLYLALISAAVSIVLAWLSFEFIEKPGIRYGKTLASRKQTPSAQGVH